jgi:hypothetical protein
MVLSLAELEQANRLVAERHHLLNCRWRALLYRAVYRTNRLAAIDAELARLGIHHNTGNDE